MKKVNDNANTRPSAKAKAAPKTADLGVKPEEISAVSVDSSVDSVATFQETSEAVTSVASDSSQAGVSKPVETKPKARRTRSSSKTVGAASKSVDTDVSTKGKSTDSVSRPSAVGASGAESDIYTTAVAEGSFSGGQNQMVNIEDSARYSPNRSPSFQPYQVAHQNSDRIAIFIDGSNLFYAASHLNIEVDYRRLLTTLVRGRRLLRAYFYTGVDPQNEKQRGFLLWLNRHGHRVVSKELAHLPDGSRKANMHVEMAVDMMRIAEYCSTLTLLGGDGNLAYALQVLSGRGTSIEVVSLQSMTSDSLIDLADSYTDLADLRNEIKR
ncbi:MAG: NYN domain-containing protein [Cyanobacteria bacterium J06597_16]